MSAERSQNTETALTYFSLLDEFSNSSVFEKIFSLFTDDIEFHTLKGTVLHGLPELVEFIKEFNRKQEGGKTKHYYRVTKEDADTVVVEWALAGQNPDGTVYALQGSDIITFDDQHKIKKLTVQYSSP